MADGEEGPVEQIEIIIEVPLLVQFQCPRCVNFRENQKMGIGVFKDQGGLSKHLNNYHPNEFKLIFKCSVCGYFGKTKYPAKDVKAHYDKKHPPEAVSTRARTSSDRTATK